MLITFVSRSFLRPQIFLSGALADLLERDEGKPKLVMVSKRGFHNFSKQRDMAERGFT